MILSDALRRLLDGTPWGAVFPRRPEPRQPVDDARTAAMRVLARYLAEITFYRPGDRGGPAIPFRVSPQNIHVEWPDYEVPDEYPALVILQRQDGSYEEQDADYLGPSARLLDETLGRYARGTAVLEGPDYIEQVVIECHAAQKPERRALMKGLELALLSPTEESFGVSFLVPDNFDSSVSFWPIGRAIDESPDSARNRRIGKIYLEMRLTTQSLVNVVRLRPAVKTSVDVDIDTGLAVALEDGS